MYYIDTTDKRNKILKELLHNHGEKVDEFLWQGMLPQDIVVFSPAKKFTQEQLKTLSNNIVMYAGNLSDEMVEILKNKKIIYKNLLLDEIFTIKNANLTTEGVLALILENSDKSIYDNNVLIIGGGRIAKAMAVLLGKLDVNFAMVSFNKVKYPDYYIYSKKCYFGYSFVKDLEKFDVIVNTIPAKILDDDIVPKIAKNTVFIETASVQCLNKELVKDFNYIEAPGLPQRFSAYTAGKLVFENIMGENIYE